MSEQHILTAALQGQSQAAYLERLNDHEFWEYASQLAAAPALSTSQIESYLECELRQEQARVIFPLASLREVLPPPHHVTLLPASPRWMPGLTAWRSEPIPVVNLEAYLTRRRVQHAQDSMLLVVQQNDVTLGLFVSLVGSLTALEPERLLPAQQPPDWCTHLPSHLLLGTYVDALVLNMPEILIDIIQQMRVMAVYE